MAGFRQFVTGEVLTASNVDDFLAKQAVMKFADAAARNSALGTATGGSNALREGMVAYLDSTDELLKYDGTGWAAIGAAGIGSNVVQTVKTDVFSTSSLTFTAVTGLTATITPSSATSKILIVVQLNFAVGTSTGGGCWFRLSGGTNTTAYVGDEAGTRGRVALGSFNAAGTVELMNSGTIVFVDAPATTSATTYELQLRASTGGSVFVNRSINDSDGGNGVRGASSITVIEVAA